mgnify:CR=1 FL=1
MDRKLRKILTDCIGDIETGALDMEGCLQRHPDRAAELRPHLELWSGLNASAKAQPNFGSQQRGQNQLLGALSDIESKRAKRMIPLLTPTVAKATVALAAAALLVGGAAGASAAFGGPDFADEVLSTVGIKGSHDGGHAADAAQDGLDTAHDGSSTSNSGGEPAAAEDGQSTADAGADNSVDGPAAAEDGLDNTDDAPQASDSVPENAQVPESVPVGHTP